MTAKTRRRVFLCVLVVALTVPGEFLLLRAVSTPDVQVAVQQWAVGLNPQALDAAGAAIDTYPLMYRKAIMKVMTPDRRAAVWRGYVERYIVSHPGLDAPSIALLASLESSLTRDVFEAPTDANRATIHALADQITTTLGRSVAEDLMYALGPRDGTFASAEPISMRFTNYVRASFAAFASDPDCDCNMYWGCYDWGTHCSQKQRCNVDNDWPMCGWLWNDPCDGLCASGLTD